MGQGLRVWDENGVNLVDTDYRMTQIIGSVYTADLLENNEYINGNIYVPEFASLAGTPFVLNIPTDAIFVEDGHTWGVAHSAKIEDNYVKWKYNTASDINPVRKAYASWIIWGVY